MVGIGMKGIGKLGAAGAAGLLALAVVPALAEAEPPTVTITAPSPGTLTKERTPTFAGTTSDALDTVTVDVYQGPAATGTPVREEIAMPSAGAWSVQASPALADGTYTAIAQQGTAEVGFSGEVTFTIDATKPALTLNAVPAATNDSTPSFGGAAGTAAGDNETVTAIVYVGSSPSGTQAASGTVPVQGGAWSFTAPALADGTYTVQASQSDAAGNTGTSASGTFRVDTVAPGPLTLNAVPSVLSTATPTFGGSAGTVSGDGAVRVIVDGTLAGEASASSGSWKLTSPHLGDGSHTVLAEQIDEAGNVSKTSAASFKVDTTAPSPLTLNAVAAVLGTATPAFGGSGGQATGDGPVHVLIDGKAAGEAPVSAGAWSFTAAALGDGSHTVRAEQSDEAGNTSKTSTASFCVDTTAPAPTVTGPKAGETLKSSLVEFHGAAGSATACAKDSGELAVELFHGESTAEEALAQTFPVTRSGSSWSVGGSGPRLSNGTYTVRVKQADSIGNVGFSPAVSFTVASPAPNVTLEALPRFTANTTPSFAGSADTSTEAKPEVTLKIWRGASASGTLVESATGAVSAGAWSLGPIQALEDGTYTAQAEQPTVAKNPAGVSETTTFTVDTKAPEPTLLAPGESDGLETVTGLAGTAPGDRRQITTELFSGEGTDPESLVETITVNDNADGTWSATFANLSGGRYTVLAHQSDEAGNLGTSAPQAFTVAVPLTIVPPAPASVPAPPAASFTWVPAEPIVGQSVSFVSKSTDDFSPITGYGWDLVGAGPFAPGGPVVTTAFTTPGPHVVRLLVSDANGLSSTATETVVVSARALQLMQPFPIVRIAGAETASGARIRLLSVQAPPKAKIAISCKGGGCKTRSEKRVVVASRKSKRRSGAVTMSFPRFQRSLAAGAVLQIRVSKSGLIGKYTSFKIRRNRLPLRVDSCLLPSSSRPSPCPSQ